MPNPTPELKRYKIEMRFHEWHWGGGSPSVMTTVEDPSGPYHLATDVAATLAAKDAEIERLTGALREIQRGKTQADNEHPLGEYASMAIRFMNIARDALRDRTLGEEGKATCTDHDAGGGGKSPL